LTAGAAPLDATPVRGAVGEHIQALLDGDFSRGLAGFAEDVVWHVPGDGELAGEHRGREAVLAVIERLFSPAHDRGLVAFRALGAHDGYEIAWVEIGRSNDAQPIGFPVVSRVQGGRIREVWWCGMPLRHGATERLHA
jgi:ketosteroid isomerase-like protein